MAISIDDIKKLRAMTGAGLADVKKALTEAEGDFDKAKELLRERGLAIAAKRSDRETSNGCVLAKCDNGFAAILALKCETDFVANGADFIALTQQILDAAVAAKVKTLDEVRNWCWPTDRRLRMLLHSARASQARRWSSMVTMCSKARTLKSTTTWASTLSALWFRPTSPLPRSATRLPCRWLP